MIYVANQLLCRGGQTYGIWHLIKLCVDGLVVNTHQLQSKLQGFPLYSRGSWKRQIQVWSDTDADTDTNIFTIHFYIYKTVIFHT